MTDFLIQDEPTRFTAETLDRLLLHCSLLEASGNLQLSNLGPVVPQDGNFGGTLPDGKPFSIYKSDGRRWRIKREG